MEFLGGLGFVRLPLKRFYMYILKRLIGGFLRHDIDLEQLDVQLYRGIVQLKSLELDVAQLNLAALGGGLLLHFASAIIGCIKMDIPWRHLLRDHCKVYVSGLDFVLAKGVAEAAAEPGRGPAPVPAAPGAALSPRSEAQDEAPAERPPGRYSEEGIETLSRLVKLVMSRMELCIDEASISLQAPPAERALRARVASVVVFSEQPADGVEERAARVAGVSLAMVPRALPPPTGPRPPPAGELLLAATDAPREAEPVGTLRVRRGRGLAGSADRGQGVHLDVELSLHAVRFVLSPAPCRALAELLAAMDAAEERREASAEEAEGHGDPPADLSHSASIQRPPFMMQSLVESSLLGSPGAIGFWYDLYNLFEADSQLEDAAGHAAPAGAEAEAEGEDISLDEGPEELGRQDNSEGAVAGPLVGCNVRVSVAHIAGLLVLGDSPQGLAPQPADVPLLPGPAQRVCGDHAQLCVGGWAATFEQRKADAAGAVAARPSATVLAKSVAVHLHRRNRSEAAAGSAEAAGHPPEAKAEEEAAVPAAGLADAAAAAEAAAEGRRAPEEYIIHSQSERDASPSGAAGSSSRPPFPPRMAVSEMEPMFCSAYSHAAPEASAAARVARTPEPGSCRCSTTESLGELGSEEDSFLHSAASSVRSLDDSSTNQAARGQQRGSSTDVFASATGAAPSAGPEARAAPEDRTGSAREALLAAAARLRLSAAVGPEGEEESEGESEEESEEDSDEDDEEDEDEDLETVFFDRSRPIRDALAGRRRVAIAETPAGMAEDGGNATSSTDPADWRGWHRVVPDFRSKRVLYVLPLAGSDGRLWNANGTGSGAEPSWEPPLALPPVGHPLWDGLRLVEGGRSTIPEVVGHQVYAEWVGPLSVERQRSQPSVTLECQPVIVSLCAESVHMLTGGTSWLGDLAAVPQQQAARRPAAVSWRPRERGGTRRPPPASFALVGAVPLIRVEIALGATERGPACLVGELVLPRVFGQPQSDVLGGAHRGPPGRHMAGDQSYEESLRLDVEDVSVVLKCGAGGLGDDSRGSMSPSGEDGDGERACCLPLLSILQPEGAAASAGAKLSCSLFRQCLEGLEGARAPPPARRPQEPQPAPAAAQATQHAWSEWTKISVPPAATESRSSLVLQDLRQATHQLLRPGQGARDRSSASVPPRFRDRGERDSRPDRAQGIDEALETPITARREARPGSPRARRTARASSVDAARAADAEDGGSRHTGELELSLRIPGTLQVQSRSSDLPFLQESLAAFGRELGELAAPPAETSWAASSADEPPDAAPIVPLGCTLSVGSVCLRLLEGEAAAEADTSEEAEDGQEQERELQVRLSPMTCRLLRSSRSDLQICCAGQDFRLEDRTGAAPEQLVSPWFRPMSRAGAAAGQAAAGGGSSSSSSLAAPLYPWEVRRAGCLPDTVQSILSDVESGRWRETYSFLLQLEKQALAGAEHASLSVKANRLLVNAHHHLKPVYLRLLGFFGGDATGGTSGQLPARTPPREVLGCQVSILDCLVDLPSEGYDSACLCRPAGAGEAPRPAATEGLAGDEWRAVVHVDGLELALQGCNAQSFQVGVGECNVLLVDRPGHLSSTDITSALPRPVAHLTGLGFARVLGLTGATAAWRCQGGGPPPDGKGRQSLEISVEELSGHACADTVKCLLCVGMELAEMLPAPAASESGPEAAERAAEASPAEEEVPDLAELLRAAPALPQASMAEPPPPAEAVADPNLSILENIDMFAFESDAAPGSELPAPGGLTRAPSSPGELPLESVMIDDYIRAQEQQQSPRMPVRASVAGTRSGGQAPPASVAVCLFDPEAYPAGQLRELRAQDQSAREEVDRLLAGEGPEEAAAAADVRPSPARERREAPAATGAGAAPAREVMHQDGSAAVWFVDPDEVQVVSDHFAQWRSPEDEPKRLLPAKAPPVQLLIKLQCRTAQLSLYAGTDFDEDARGRLRAPASREQRQTSHLTLQLQECVASAMVFDPEPAPPGGSSGNRVRMESVPRRRYLVCAKDVSVLDHVQGSVFSHLLSYFEDERRRPRPSHADMLRLVVDEVSPPFPPRGAAASAAAAAEAPPEYRVEVRLLPLQLTVDQDVVDFLLEYVQLCTLPTYVEEDPQETSGSSPSDSPEAFADPNRAAAVPLTAAAAPPMPPMREPFLQHVSVGPLLLSVDYRAKRLDVDALRRGELWELVNLLPLLEGLQIAFRGVTVGGVSGLNQLAAQVVGAWSADLNRTQILRSLTGVTPIRSFANIGGGFAEMVLEPLKQYRTGGGRQRISRTILRGLVSFLKHVTVESIDLTERIFVGTQSALEYMNACLHEQPQGAVGAGRPPAPAEPFESPVAEAWTAVERGASDFLQPGGAAEGLEQACTSLTRGMRHASEAVVVRPLLELHRGAPRNQVIRSVVTGIPMCVLQPAIGATAAATTALRGVRNSVDPLHRREMVQKYKGPE